MLVSVPMRRLLLLVALCGCGDRVPIYAGPPFPHDPPPPASWAGKIVTSNNGDDTLSVVDPLNVGPAIRVPVGFNPVELEGPHHLSVDPAGRFVYLNLSMAVASSGSGPHGSHGSGMLPGWVLKLDTTTGREVGRVNVDSNPGDNVLSPDGKTLYVTHYDIPRWARGLDPGASIRAGDSMLAVIDTETMGLRAKVPICPAAHGVRLSPDGARLYATCGPDEIAVVSLPDLGVRRVPLTPGGAEGGGCVRCPYALAVAPDGVVWVAGIGSGGRGSLHLFDPALPGGGDFDQGAVVQFRGGAMFAAFTGDATAYRAYLPERAGGSGDQVHIYESQPRGQPPREVGTIPLTRADCQNAHMILVEGPRGYLICEGDMVNPGTFVWLDLDGRKALGSVAIGVFPDGLALVRAR
jgi:hypothetical protein